LGAAQKGSGQSAAALKIECGSKAVDFGRDAYRSERTQHDARLEADYYYVAFQVAGRSTLSQNEEVAQLAVGDVALRCGGPRHAPPVTRNGCGFNCRASH
jgi:hypothetical protein